MSHDFFIKVGRGTAIVSHDFFIKVGRGTAIVSHDFFIKVGRGTAIVSHDFFIKVGRGTAIVSHDFFIKVGRGTAIVSHDFFIKVGRGTAISIRTRSYTRTSLLIRSGHKAQKIGDYSHMKLFWKKMNSLWHHCMRGTCNSVNFVMSEFVSILAQG